MNKIDKLPPFKRFCVTIGNLPSSYVDSMSYYECLMWLCKYLKDTVIPAVNENAEAVNELINWFNNLDVQDEIDNKLDEMAESGQLQEIIASYLNVNSILAFNTVSDMKNSENLTNGSFVRTFGKLTYNDGLGHYYKIRNITSGDVVDEINIIALTNSETLIAELIPEDDDEKIVFIGDSWTTEYPSGTNMWYLQVAKKLNLTPLVYGDGGSGFVHPGGHGTFLTQVNNAIATIENKKSVKIIAITGGINDYHDENVTETQVRTAVSEVLTLLETNFPDSEIVYTPLNYSYEQMTERAFLILNALKSGCIGHSVTLLNNCYNWIKTFPQTYAYYDTHMNQTGNNIFATSWLSEYHGIGYNHRHIYQPYPVTGITVLKSNAVVVGSKVSIYAQLQVASGTTLNDNTKIITFDNNVVGLPLYNLSARAITCWVNLQTSNGNVFKTIPAYLNVKQYPGTESGSNQGELEIICHCDNFVVNNNSSYIYITCDIDTALM